MSSPFNPLGPAHYDPHPDLSSAGRSAPRVGVFFASREGHTREIAERIGAGLRSHGFDIDLLDVRQRLPFALSSYSAAVLAASVHGGNHEPEMVQFVKDHRQQLEGMTTAFLSVTLSEAGAERPGTTPTEHARFVHDVDAMLTKFFDETKWTPSLVKPVAGALVYSRYNFLLRLIMRSIAKKAGGDTDTSRDYDYTDWAGLDKFIAGFAAQLGEAKITEAQPGRLEGMETHG